MPRGYSSAFGCWDGRTGGLGSASLREGHTFPKPATASLKDAANWEPDTPRPPPGPPAVTAASLGWQGGFLGGHNSPPFPLPPRAIGHHQSQPLAATRASRGPQRGGRGVTAGWPRAGGRGRCPCREPCPREDVTTCSWCALASGSINALLAAGRSCTAAHGGGDRHLDTDPCGDRHLGTHTRTDGHQHSLLGQGTRPPAAPHPSSGGFAGPVSHPGGTGGQMSRAGGDKPRQAGADALENGGGEGLPRAFGGRGGSSFPSDC